ncbi:hypothetical protein FGF1_14800 [Flavobacteriaceae bacterium GF1]
MNGLKFTLLISFLSFLPSNAQFTNIFPDDGNVGIGTLSPIDKLEIRDGRVRISDGNDRMYLGVENDSSRSIIAFGDDTNDRLGFYFDYWNGTSQDKELMSIHGNGRVGIGTTNPDAKLAVKGDIHAQEVKVDLNGAVAPDYVFKEDYDLRSLQEVQDYIKKHGHLPNVPSAKELEENGIELGALNMKLLEKIEELTLYVIELKKQNEQQQEEIEELKKSKQ